MKKLAVTVLAAAMLLPALVSCGNSPANPDTTTAGGVEGDTTPAAESSTAPAKITARDILATLPDKDFGGYEFRVLTSNWVNTTLECRQAPEETETGEPINDALFARDKLVEEKYNIKIKYTIMYDGGDMANAAKKSIMAGDNTYDMICGDMMNVAKTLAQTGAVYDFNKIPNIDLTNIWWSQNARSDLTINGKFYFPTGDISTRYLNSPYLFLFNKKLFQDRGLDFPYQTVLDGKWTLDALMNLLKGQTKDLDGNGVYDANDFYGLAAESFAPYPMLIGSGESLTKVVDGNPTLNIDSPRVLAATEKLLSFMSDIQYVYYPSNYKTYDEVPVFKNGHSLMVGQTAGNLSLFRDMDDNYGLLPMPKLDENQEKYYSFCQPWGSTALSVPLTNPDIDRTGMIIEALGAAAKYTSTPAMYEVTLKQKFSRDNDSEAMLDIIYGSTCYDFTMLYDWGTLYSKYSTNIYKNAPIVSEFEKVRDKAQSALQKTIDEYAAKA